MFSPVFMDMSTIRSNNIFESIVSSFSSDFMDRSIILIDNIFEEVALDLGFQLLRTSGDS